MKNLNYIRQGCGTPLLLVHGLGGSSKSWSPILNQLRCERDVIAVDLPGAGQSPYNGEDSVSAMADTVTEFLVGHHLLGVDAVGSSMGARLVLELARRGGVIGSTVALSPGGFWQGVERHAFYASMFGSIRMIRMLEPVLPEILSSKAGRAGLLAQFSARPDRLSPQFVVQELMSLGRSEVADDILFQLAYGEEQRGAEYTSISSSLVIVWGRQDRVCFPHEAERALQLFPDAKIRWIDHCGHYPHWDAPDETIQLILENTGSDLRANRRRAKADVPKTLERVQSTPHDSPVL